MIYIMTDIYIKLPKDLQNIVAKNLHNLRLNDVHTELLHRLYNCNNCNKKIVEYYQYTETYYNDCRHIYYCLECDSLINYNNCTEYFTFLKKRFIFFNDPFLNNNFLSEYNFFMRWCRLYVNAIPFIKYQLFKDNVES